MAQKRKYYVVWTGKKPGVYLNWEACQKQVAGVKGSQYKSFLSKREAEKAFEAGPDLYKMLKPAQPEMTTEQIRKFGRPIIPSICVDAACSGNPGTLEYRGVETETASEIFKMGPFEQGTVNIGEFLAIVHALALLHKHTSDLPVYSDSTTALTWIRVKKVNTKLVCTESNVKLFELIKRAEKWLQNNQYSNQILKWHTGVWGEIPADFGRK